MSRPKTAITPTREEDFSEWYQQVVKVGELAEHAPVRGCMVIKPWGYSIWENIQYILNKRFKATGHKNAYFPLFIPLSFLEKEAEHVEGFAKECAVVTHHRLEAKEGGGLQPAGELEEPLVVRPTSETIIGETFSKWVESYRDLPILINQWANVVRWEMRTRLFLRTAEFLWQEGHTAHETKEEALEETFQMLDIYCDFIENMLAMPLIRGAKTESERFPGAEETYTFELMMQDHKALQGGTSHFLGQKFAKASNIKFSDRNGNLSYAWTTSWAITTRLIGAMVMIHGDDDGFICPPRIAPEHLVIIPIVHKEEMREHVMTYCEKLAAELSTMRYGERDLEVTVDKRDLRGGEKSWSAIKKGMPLRLEVGPRDIDSDQLCLFRRTHGHKEVMKLSRAELLTKIIPILDEMQNEIFERARAFRDQRIKKIDTKDDFYAFFTPKNRNKPEIHGGFALAHWSGESAVEQQIKNDLNVTIRCIPLDHDGEEGKCIITGKPSKQRVLFAKAY